MQKHQIDYLVESQVRRVLEDEPEPEPCGCDESQHYVRVLVRLRAEFDYLFAHREDSFNYAALLEHLIMNRLEEARMPTGMFGENGIAGLPAPYNPKR